MKILDIIHDSVVDGDGLRTVVFFAGCPHHCHGCHNPESWHIDNGMTMSIEEVLAEIHINPLTNVTFSGGEPFYQAKEIAALAKEIKTLGKNIWIYSGYTFEQLQNIADEYVQELLSCCDVLVDGPFNLEQRDLSLRFRGSKNQRIIHLKEHNQNHTS